MSTQFLSKVDRIDKFINGHQQYVGSAGPGSYDIPSSLRSPKPGFTGFASSDKGRDRLFDAAVTNSPSAGSYNIGGTGMIKTSSTAASAFKSKTKRFDDFEMEEEPVTTNPIDAQFVEKLRKRPSPNKSPNKTKPFELVVSLINEGPRSPAPSVPTKYQSFGFEEDDVTGKLIPKRPLTGSDVVGKESIAGPGSYNINRDIHNGSAVNFGLGSNRDMFKADKGTSPGPGYYNKYSNFDLADTNRRVHDDKEADFIFRLHASRKKLSAAFASKIGRELALEGADNPGPGLYNIPSSIQVGEPMSPDKQSFGTSGTRFADDAPKSMILNIAPGQYSPITSDFEKDRIKILRKKKMTSSSGWAQNISFDATEPKFYHPKDQVVPPVGSYDPKTQLHHQVKSLGNPLTFTGDRFGAQQKSLIVPKRDDVIARELENELNENFKATLGSQEDRNNRKQKKKPQHARLAPEFDRFPREKTPEGPSPNAYDTSPSWTSKTIKMAPSSALFSHQLQYLFRKRANEPPPPSYYNLPSTMGVKKGTTKEVLISAAPREPQLSKYTASLPGPGTYNISSSLDRPSHNIYLAT